MNQPSSAVAETNGNLLRSDYFIKSISGKYVFTSVIAMVFLYASSLIDTVLVGLFIGESALSAMSLVSPVYLIYYTVGATVGIGASILASRELGRGNEKKHDAVFSVALEITVALAVIMTALGYGFIDSLTDFLARGVDEEQRTMVKQYLLSYFPGGAFNLLSYISMYFLKTDGKPKVSAGLYVGSAVINVVLSALFISPLFDFGVAGAGAATSISLAFAAVLGLIILLCSSSTASFHFTKIERKDLRELLLAGLPNGLSNFLESIRIFMLNFIIIAIGCSALLPCYTVIRNVSDIISAVMIGISSALVPMMGVFFGERDYKSERMLMNHAEKIGLITVLLLVAAVSVCSKWVFLLFGVTDLTLLNEGVIALPLSVFGLIVGYRNTLYINYLTAVKREAFATVLVVLRLFLALVVLVVPLSALFSTFGVWISLSLAEIVTAVVYEIGKRLYRRKNPRLDKYLLSADKDKEDDLSFSVKNDPKEVVRASAQLSVYCEEHDVDMKRAMKLSLAIEEILVFLLDHCVGTDEEQYVDIRVCKLEDEVMLRFRYTGAIFDPVTFYQENEDNQDLQDELLGLKMMMKTASLVDFKQMLGANNLLLIF